MPRAVMLLLYLCYHIDDRSPTAPLGWTEVGPDDRLYW